MTAFLSEDDGETWPHRILLDARRTSYPDACEGQDGTIHIVHDHGRQSHKEVIFHRITEDDIRAGKVVKEGSVIGHIANKATAKTISNEEYQARKSAR